MKKAPWKLPLRGSVILRVHTMRQINLSVLSSYVKSGGPVLDTASADINQADVAIKLWLMLMRKFENSCRQRESVYDTV